MPTNKAEDQEFLTQDEFDALSVEEQSDYDLIQIDELSVDTLKSYYKKAGAERQNAKTQKDRPMRDRINTMLKRGRGMDNAIQSAGKKVLNQEDTELDEATSDLVLGASHGGSKIYWDRAKYATNKHELGDGPHYHHYEIHHSDGSKKAFKIPSHKMELDYENNHLSDRKLIAKHSGLSVAHPFVRAIHSMETGDKRPRSWNESVEDINEATTAAATLSPESMTKAGMMASVMGAMNGAKKSDLVDFFNQAMAQFGPNNFPGADATNKSAQNMASISTKASVKEDVEEMFASDTDLSEEFKTKVETIFEAAINAKLEVELARIHEEQEADFDALVEEHKEELAEKVDEYLTYAVNQWVEDNRLQIENGLKIEIFENFMDGLKTLFAENNVSIPDEEISLVSELADKVEELEVRVNEEIEKNMQLTVANGELIREQTFADAANGLADSQVEKFHSLAEGITYGDLNEYRGKLAIIKETYFSKKPANRIVSEEVVGIDMLSEDTKAPATGPMAVYADAISRTIKKN